MIDVKANSQRQSLLVFLRRPRNANIRKRSLHALTLAVFNIVDVVYDFCMSILSFVRCILVTELIISIHFVSVRCC